MRIFFGFFILIASTIPSFAQVGTKEEAIQAAKDRQEPPYIKELMSRLSAKIARHAAKKEIQTPADRLVWISTMQGFIELAHSYANHASKEGAWHLMARDYAENAAKSAALERARLRTEKAVWSIEMKAHASLTSASHPIEFLNAAKYASLDAAFFGSSRDEIGRIAYRVVERETLNWLFDDFETEIAKIDRDAEKIARTRRAEGPLIDLEYTIEFYNEQFEVLADSVIQFLAPWLIHLVPPDRAGRHEALFFDLNISNQIARGR